MYQVVFKKHGLTEGYLEACQEKTKQEHITGCLNGIEDDDLDVEYNPCYRISCSCPWVQVDNTLLIIPVASKLKAVSLAAFTKSNAEAIIEIDGKTIEVPYNDSKLLTLEMPEKYLFKKDEGVRVRLTKPTKHPFIYLIFEQVGWNAI